jgi:hypothetical protein
MVDSVTHLFLDFSQSQRLVSTCDFCDPIINYLLRIFESDAEAECKVTCLESLAYFCHHSPSARTRL